MTRHRYLAPPSLPRGSHGADTWLTCFHPSLDHLPLIDAVRRCMERAHGHCKGASSCHDSGDELHWSPLTASFAILLHRLCRSHQADSWLTCFHPPLDHLFLIDAVHTCMERACGHWKGAGSCHSGGGDLHWSPLTASFAILLLPLFAHIKLTPASPASTLPLHTCRS